MYSRRFSCVIASTSLCIVAAACAVTATEAATPPVAGWHSPNSPSAASRASTAASSQPNWEMPSDHQSATNDPSTVNSINPLRQRRAATGVQPREPVAFEPPVNAKQMTADSSASERSAAFNTQRGSSSAAVSQAAAVLPQRPVATSTRAAASGRPTNNQRVARSARSPQGRPSPHERGWQRFNVAMQAPEEAGVEAEDLPLPSHFGKPSFDPFGPDANAEYGDPLEGEYYPSCGPDGCGDACSCGGVCEPGCGCGTGCGCGDGPCGCGGECCNDCFCVGPGDPESCHSVRIRVPKWQELTFFGGVQGFKGPYDHDRDSGNFGFHEGFNSSFKIPYTYMGYQIGYQAAHSQLNGDKDTDIEDSHTQHFITFGLFRRVTDGLQFGTAWDVLRDQRFDAVDFHQLRSELSWMDCGRHEFGVSATVGLNQEEVEDDDDELWQASDQYLLFYRVHGKRGGEGRVFGGWNDVSDGIVGADMQLPVHDRWSVQTGFTYMVPDAQDGEDGAAEEAWNLNISLVWHWDCRARKSFSNPYRPLFNVANNGSLIVDNREDD